MKASREDLVIYCSCLEEVKRRLKVVRSITQAEFSTDNVEMDAEIACLQLRKALELIAFASLSANHSLYTRVHGDISSAWSAKRILNKLEKLHPDFYPRPILFEGESEGGVKHFANVKSGYLTRAEFVVLYDKCSSVVHAWNPRKLGVRRVDFGLPVAQWVEKIETLLGVHYLTVPGDDSVYVAYLAYPLDGKAHVFTGTAGQ